MRFLLIVGAALVGCGGTSTESPGTGGGSGTGGSGGTGGGVPEDCGTVVTFRLTGSAPAGEPNICLGQPGSCGGGGAWLQVLDATGQTVLISKGCQNTDCSDCELTGCPAICAQSTPLPDAGIELTWTGVMWTGGQTCGENLQCVTPECAAPDSYTARFCGYAVTGASGAGGGTSSFSWCEDNAETTPTCVDVPFELPSSATVEGVLPPG